MLILNDLARTWASDTQLLREVQSWSWFSGAFQAALDDNLASDPGAFRVDRDVLAKAFFDWAQSVEVCAPYETLDRIDFLHFISGLLLQNLLAAQPAVLVEVSLAHAAPDTPAHTRRGETLLTGFVLTLLQAFRIQAGAPALPTDLVDTKGPYWSSFLENVTEDSKTAIAFLDQMCGLQPVWQSPSLIESRPAMQRALARSRTEL